MVNKAFLRILLVVALFFVFSEALFTNNAGSTLPRFNQFISKLTTVLSDGYRAVHSSGGAAGGVVSEGQGYGLLIGGITAASLGSSHTSFDDVATKAYQMFKGWKKMCTLSSGSSSCQTGFYYCTATVNNVLTYYPCLPHWKFDDSITSSAETGNAPDGDEDAILGMIVLVMATQSLQSKYTWWSEVGKWAYQSAKQFYESNTAKKDISSVSYPMLKLGACWGGWDCNNPSYHAPGAYRAFREFLVRYSTTFGGSSSDATPYVNKYNRLIATSYALLLADQCDTTGLTTNWYKPDPNNPPTTVGSTGCSGSGTAAAEYGAEAARGSWRVALDYIWYGESANNNAFLNPLVTHVASKYSGGSFGSLSTGCLVTSVFASWTSSSNAFIYGPTFSALVKPVVANQQTILDAAGSIVAAGSISSYYSGAWTAISTFTLNGDLERVGSLIRGGPLPPVAPSPPPVSVPTPPPTPVAPSSLISYTCSYAHDDVYWIEFNVAGVPTGASVWVECNDGTQRKCVSNFGKWQCDSSGKQCPSPRSVIVKDAKPGCCSMGRLCSKAQYAEEDVSTVNEEQANAGLIAGIAIACVVLVALIAFVVYQLKARYFPFQPMETY